MKEVIYACDICGKSSAFNFGTVLLSGAVHPDMRSCERIKYNDLCIDCAKKIYKYILELEEQS
jgi:hypothetical protein